MAIHYVEPNGSAPSISRHSTTEPAIPKQDIHEHTASESSVTGFSSSKPSTPEQPDAKPVKLVTVEPVEIVTVEPVEPAKSAKSDKPTKAANPEEEEKPVYLPRADRMNQTPTKGNAQGLFLPDCCVFVGK
jgi:hypothetical protein